MELFYWWLCPVLSNSDSLSGSDEMIDGDLSFQNGNMPKNVSYPLIQLHLNEAVSFIH